MPKLFPSYRDEIRKKIITEAFAVFLEKGFEKTTLDEIAARLEVTKPALYRYFKNKDELFISSIVELAGEEYGQFQEILFTGDDIMANASVYFDAVLAFSRKYQILMMDIFTVMRRNRSFRNHHPDFHEEFIRMMQDGFEVLIQRGVIHPDFDNRTLAILCGSLIGGLVHFVVEDPYAVEAKEVWLKGYAKLVRVQRR